MIDKDVEWLESAIIEIKRTDNMTKQLYKVVVSIVMEGVPYHNTIAERRKAVKNVSTDVWSLSLEIKGEKMPSLLTENSFKSFLLKFKEQQKVYASKYDIPDPDNLTKEDSEKYITIFIGHLIEEANEARMLVPRKHWKDQESYLDSEEGKIDFCHELCDIFLFFSDLILYSGIDLDFMLERFEDKMNKNITREDWK